MQNKPTCLAINCTLLLLLNCDEHLQPIYITASWWS